MSTRPTIQEVQEAERFYFDRWAEARADWEIADTFYDNRFLVWNHDGKHPEHANRSALHPSRARGLVDHFVDNQMAVDPKVHRQVVGRQAEEPKKDASAIERFIKASITDSFMREMALPSKAIAKYLSLNGYANCEAPLIEMVGEPVEPERAKGDTDKQWERRKDRYEAELAGWNPFRIRVYNPTRILLDPDERIPTFGIRQSFHLARDLAKIAKKLRADGKETEWQEEDGEKPFTYWRSTDYWTDEWHLVIVSQGDPKTTTLAESVSGKLFLAEENEGEYVPFSHAFAGFGHERTGQDGSNPKWRAQGLLSGEIESLRAFAQAMTAAHNKFLNKSYTPMGTRLTEGQVTARAGMDFWTELGGKDDIWPIDAPDMEPWMFEHMRTLDESIEFGTSPRILGGFRPEGVTAVGTTALLSVAAQQKSIAPGRQMDFIFSQIAANMLRWIDMSGKSLTIGGETITPEMIRGNYTIEVKFELVNPVVHLQEKQVAMQEFKELLRSKESYWEVARLEDTEREQDRLLEDWLMTDPDLKFVAARATEKGVSLRELLDEAKKQAKLRAQKGSVGGGLAGLVKPNGEPLFPPGGEMMPGSPAEAARASEQMGQAIGAPQLTAAGIKPPQNITAGRNGA